MKQEERMSKMSRKDSEDKAKSGAPNRIAEVKMDVSIEIGRKRVPIETLLDWREGSLLELNRVCGDPVDVRVNGEPFAKGEVVAIAENFGVRLLEIVKGEDA